MINCTHYHEHTQNIFANYIVAPLYFDTFLEKIELKDDGSNNAEWVRDLRIVLIAAQKAYVLDAALGAPPPQASSVDVVNI